MGSRQQKKMPRLHLAKIGRSGFYHIGGFSLFPNDIQRDDPYFPTWKYGVVRKLCDTSKPQSELFQEFTKFQQYIFAIIYSIRRIECTYENIIYTNIETENGKIKPAHYLSLIYISKYDNSSNPTVHDPLKPGHMDSSTLFKK